MELGPRKGEAAFIDKLIAVVQRHPVDRCTLTVYAIGIVYVEVWFGASVPDGFLRGLTKCFEYAARGEIDEQVGGYLRKTRGGRDPEDLNRLRNLALAVVSLTESSVVTETEEDREYFAAFEQVANTDKKRQFISTAADMVYSVADAETQRVNARRQNLFSVIAPRPLRRSN